MINNDCDDDNDDWVNQPGANGAKSNHCEKIGLSTNRQHCKLVQTITISFALFLDNFSIIVIIDYQPIGNTASWTLCRQLSQLSFSKRLLKTLCPSHPVSHTF